MRIAALLLIAGCLYPGAAYAGAGISSAFSVTSVNARDVGTYAVGSGFNNPFPCASADTVRIDNGATNGDMLRATLLTAFATGKQVKVWVSGCAADGVSNVLSVSAE